MQEITFTDYSLLPITSLTVIAILVIPLSLCSNTDDSMSHVSFSPRQPLLSSDSVFEKMSD